MPAYRTRKAHGKSPLDNAVSPQRDADHHASFDARKKVNTGNVLHVANHRCRFMEAFDHVLGRYAKREADDHTGSAVLIARGTRKGLGRMGAMFNLGYHTFSLTSDHFIRLWGRSSPCVRHGEASWY